MTAPFTVVVPVVPAHDDYLPELMSNLSGESALIEGLVVARSELPESEATSYAQWLTQTSEATGFGSKTVLSSVSGRALAGPNRNRGWSVVNTQWTAFVDADDAYAPDRLTQLLGLAERLRPNLMLHDYWASGSEVRWPTGQVDAEAVVGSDAIAAATFPEGLRVREREGKVPGGTNIVIPANPSGHRDVHHAHVIVRTELRNHVRYGTLKRMEDGQFCRDVLFGLGGVVYVPARLSAYNMEASTAPSSGWMRRRIGRLRRL